MRGQTEGISLRDRTALVLLRAFSTLGSRKGASTSRLCTRNLHDAERYFTRPNA